MKSPIDISLDLKGMSDKQPKQLNFNTVISVVVLAAVGWVGTSIKENSAQLSKLSERMSVMEALNNDKITRISRIEDALRDLQIDMNRIKNKP